MKKGFTLIELLVVIAIIGLLSSVVFASLNSARAKARDAKKISELNQLSKALYLFFDTNDAMPANYNPGSGACAGSSFYNQSMNELVAGGFFPQIPTGAYCYYNYGAGNSVGALLVTDLETVSDTTTGISPSCRPWAAGVNWCDQNNDKAYCLCNPY